MEDFEKLYLSHYPVVYGYLLRLCGDAHLAEEVTQEAFFRAMRSSIDALMTKAEREVEAVSSRKEQKFVSGIEDEISIFTKGADYWNNLLVRGKAQDVLNYQDEKALNSAINYCNFVYKQLSSYQIKEVVRVLNKLRENGIE